MKRVTQNLLELMAHRTGRPIEFTADRAILNVEGRDYYADLTPVAADPVMPEQVRAEMRAELIEQVAAHEGLQDRIVRMFAESFLTDARLEQVVACWPGVAPVEDVTA